MSHFLKSTKIIVHPNLEWRPQISNFYLKLPDKFKFCFQIASLLFIMSTSILISFLFVSFLFTSFAVYCGVYFFVVRSAVAQIFFCLSL